MQDYTTSFGIGFVAGMRNMTACAALTWAASEGRTRSGFIPASPEARTLATATALAEMAGDKMPFTPTAVSHPHSRPGSQSVRLADGRSPDAARHPSTGLAGVAGARAGRLLGRAVRGPDSRTVSGRAWGSPRMSPR